jgi:hypothetical protein
LLSSSPPPSRADVEEFLLAFKHKIEYGKGYVILNRPENSTDSLLALDDETGLPLWVFGFRFKKKKKTKELYIKMHIGGTDKQAVCVSFHGAKYDMVYPFNPPTTTV